MPNTSYVVVSLIMICAAWIVIVGIADSIYRSMHGGISYWELFRELSEKLWDGIKAGWGLIWGSSEGGK
jgi:hypothetical protein